MLQALRYQMTLALLQSITIYWNGMIQRLHPASNRIIPRDDNCFFKCTGFVQQHADVPGTSQVGKMFCFADVLLRASMMVYNSPCVRRECLDLFFSCFSGKMKYALT